MASLDEQLKVSIKAVENEVPAHSRPYVIMAMEQARWGYWWEDIENCIKSARENGYQPTPQIWQRIESLYSQGVLEERANRCEEYERILNKLAFFTETVAK